MATNIRATLINSVNNNGSKVQDYDLGFADLISRSGVLDMEESDNDLFVEETAVPSMNVKVNKGGALVKVEKTSVARFWMLRTDAQNDVQLAITSNVSGINRVDAVIIRAFDTKIQNGSSDLDGLDTADLQVIVGTGASPLSDGDIQTAIGSDVFYRIANVTVPDSAVSIVDANIADTRSPVEIGKSGETYNISAYLRDLYIDDNIYVDEILERTAATGVLIDGVLMKDNYVEQNEIAAPGTPASGKGRWYVDTNGLPHFINDAGEDFNLTTVGIGTEAVAGETVAQNDLVTPRSDGKYYKYDADNTTDAVLKPAGLRIVKTGGVADDTIILYPFGYISYSGASAGEIYIPDSAVDGGLIEQGSLAAWGRNSIIPVLLGIDTDKVLHERFFSLLHLPHNFDSENDRDGKIIGTGSNNLDDRVLMANVAVKSTATQDYNIDTIEEYISKDNNILFDTYNHEEISTGSVFDTFACGKDADANYMVSAIDGTIYRWADTVRNSTATGVTNIREILGVCSDGSNLFVLARNLTTDAVVYNLTRSGAVTVSTEVTIASAMDSNLNNGGIFLHNNIFYVFTHKSGGIDLRTYNTSWVLQSGPTTIRKWSATENFRMTQSNDMVYLIPIVDSNNNSIPFMIPFYKMA